MNALRVSTESTVPCLDDLDLEAPATAPEPFFTASQRLALERLDSLAEVFSRLGDAKPGGFRALVRPLVIGSTGTGKTTLVSVFAKRRGWSFLSIDAGSWIIAGAYSKPPTLQVVRDHVRSAPQTCLMVDELCKMLPSGPDANRGWYQSVFAEFLSLCDADGRLIQHGWNASDIRKLKEACFIVSGGAFSDALEAARRSIKRGELGFQQSGRSAQTHASKVAEALPSEIFTRFNADILILESPTRQDYAEGILRIHRALGRQDGPVPRELLDTAEASGKGVRYLADYLTSLLIEKPDLLSKPEVPEVLEENAQPSAKRKSFDFYFNESSHYIRQTTDYAFQLRESLGQLYGAIVARRPALQRRRNKAFARHLLKTENGGFLQMLCVGIHHSNGCFTCGSDESCQVDSLLRTRAAIWDIIAEYGPELDRYGLLDLMIRCWELCLRVAEMRATLADRVAEGRFDRQES